MTRACARISLGSVSRTFRLGIMPLALLVACSLAAVSTAQQRGESSEEALAQYADAANFQNNGAFDLAIEAWETFLEQHGDDPRSPEAAHYLGVCLMQKEEPDYRAAAAAFARALQTPRYGLREESLLNRGWSLFAAGQAEEEKGEAMLRQAAEAFDQLLKEFPRGKFVDRAYFYSAETAYALGDLERSVAQFDQWLKTPQAAASPLRCDALHGRAMALEDLGRLDEAIGGYRAVLEACEDETLAGETRLRLADALIQQNQFGEAVELLSAVEQGGGATAPYAAFRRAYALVQLDRAEEAAAAYDSILENYPESPYAAAARLAAAQSAYRAGRLDEAAEKFQRLLGDDDAAAATEAAHWLAQIALRRGQAKEAEQIAQRQMAAGAAGPYAAELQLGLAEAISLQPDRLSEAREAFLKVYQTDPRHSVAPRALYNAAFMALQSGEAAEAIPLAETFLEQYADDPLVLDVQYIAGEAQMRIGQPAEAAEAFQRLVAAADDHPQRSLWVLREATATYLAGDHDAAVERLDEEMDSLSEAAHRAEAHFLIGASHLQAERFEQAVAALQKSRQIDAPWPQADEARLLLGQAQLQGGDPEAAKQTWQSVAADASQRRFADQARYRLAQRFSEEEAFQAALEQYDAILQAEQQSPLTPYALYGRGWCLLQLEQFQAALEPLEQFLEKYPQHPLRGEAQLSRGICLRKLGRADEANEELDAFLETNPTGIQLGHALYEQGLIAQQREQPEQAAALLERLVEEVPDYPAMEKVLYELAWALRDAGRQEEAAQRFEQLVERYPESSLAAEANYFVGQQHYAAQAWEAAAEAYTRAAEGAEEDELREKALFQLGWTRLRMEDFAAAEQSFVRQSEQYPQGKLHLDSLMMVGESRFKAGRYAEAFEAYQRARERMAAVPVQDTTSETEQQMRQLVLLHGGQSAAQLERWEEALEWFAELRRRYPASRYLPQVFYETGYAHQQRGEHPQALEFYAQVADKYRTETAARARFMMGQIHFADRDVAKAVAEFQRVMYGFGAEQAPPGIRNWQAKSGFEAGRCLELLLQQTRGERREKAIAMASEMYRFVTEKHADHALASKARERLDVLARL